MMESGQKPLSHLTVLDLTVNVPGPFCSMILADMGARVIKVEPPGGDPLRHSPGMWASLNRGKQSVILDLKTGGARELLGRLAEKADIALEGWRPGVAERLGADYPTLSARNPRLVYCSISGFGQVGPWSDRAGHDVNYLALSGYLGVQAAVEGRPWPPPVLISDLVSGLYAAISALAAVSGREVSGQGAYIDLSMTDAAVSLLGPEIGRAAVEGVAGGGPNVTSIPHYGLFPCADGRWLSLGIVHEDHFWDRFCRAAGLEELAGLKFGERMARAEELRDTLHGTFSRRPSAEWERLLDKADVPAAAVTKLDEIFDNPQLKARGLFVEIGLHRFLAQPARFSTGPTGPTEGPPTPGQHTDALLKELGYGDGEAASLREGRVFGELQRPVKS